MRAVTLFFASLLVFLASAAGFPADAGDADPAVRRVWLYLDDSGELFAYQRRALQAEVSALWERYGVRVAWHARLPTEEEWAELVLMVRVSDESIAKQGPKAARPSTLGAVMFMPNQDRFLRTIYVSPQALKRLLVRSGRLRDRPLLDRVIGQATGRVVAHELGHILLEMPGHVTDGLMKPRFDADDLIVPENDHLQIGVSELEGLLQDRAITANADER